VPGPTSSRRPAPRRADFPHWTTDTIRYRDLDRQNHVNNAVFSTFLESGRVMVLREPGGSLTVPNTEYALVRAEIDFRGEMHWPGTVDIGTAIERVGTSSLTMCQALFQGERCVASAEVTVVLVDADSRRPRAFPDDLAARMRAAAPRAPEPA
jgi:acyl-CoA thioester hydrolase